MKITAELLCAKGACTGQIALFRKFYPKGKNVTLATCLRHATRFNWRWAARNLLSAPAQKACIKEIDTAQTAYDRKCDAAWEASGKASGAAWTAAAWKARDKVIAAALVVCCKASAAAFARAALSE